MSTQRQSFTTRLAALFRPSLTMAATDEKSNPAFAGVTLFSDVPQPHSMPRNYKNYADQGYAANDSVFKCVNYIITNGAAIPPTLYSDATRETEIKSHPLLDRLARPNNEQDGVTFREGVLGWYLIAGNAFLYAIRAGGATGSGNGALTSTRTTGAPDELWVLDANKVKPLPHPTRGIIGYEFTDFTDSQNPIPAANIGHLRTWNPKDPIFGLSPIEVAALMVDQQNAARKWNLALLQNMAKPSGAWVTDAALAKPERDRLEERLNEKLAGARNAGKVPVLDAGAKWTQTSLPPSELDWLKSLQYNAGQIANLYNIPPQLIGDTSASTYNNMEQAKAASYTEAIFPALDKLYSLLSMWLVPMYPDLCDAKGQPVATLYYDKTTVEVVQTAIQDRENAKADRAKGLYTAGVITLNQAQAMQGLPDLGKKGNVYRIGAVLVPADKLDDYAAQSLTEPAAPPVPQAEPIPAVLPDGTPAPTVPPTTTPPKPGKPPAKPTDPEPPEPEPKPAPAKARRFSRKASGGITVTHLMWECDGNPCEWCLENDGAIVEADENGDPVDSFPNGATSPDDSHRFCECVVHELSVPDDAVDDLPSAAPTHVADATDAQAAAQQSLFDSIIEGYAVGLIASRHNADVAAQQQQQSPQGLTPTIGADDDDDDDDDDDAEDQTGATYARPAPAKPKPGATRKTSRATYRRFMEAVL